MTKRKDKTAEKPKNRLLQITKFSVPYIKELKSLPLIKSTNACILMQQIEYWMAKRPHGFYKFQSRPQTDQYAYKEGDSWTEELGISEEEFRTAFDQMGVRYNSKTEYKAIKETGDEFGGKYYCSYFNKANRMTYYFRNNKEVEEAIDSILEVQNAASRDDDSQPVETTMFTSRNPDIESVEEGETGLESSKTTTDTKTDITSEREKSSPLSPLLSSTDNEKEIEDELVRVSVEKFRERSKWINEQLKKQYGEIPTPNDFAPTWDEKYRAVLHFPNKSVAWATNKFVSHCDSKNLELTMEQWHQKWWDWMQNERETVGNERLGDEHDEIINHVADEVFNCSYDMDNYVFDIDDLLTFLNGKYSVETLADVLLRLYEADNFGKVGNCYFNSKELEDWWPEIMGEIRSKEMLDEIVDVRSLPDNKNSLRGFGIQ